MVHYQVFYSLGNVECVIAQKGMIFVYSSIILFFFTFKAFACIQRARKLAFLLISHFILHFVTCAILSDEPKQLIHRYSRSFFYF